MRNKSRPQLTIYLLLMAAVYLKAYTLRRRLSFMTIKRNWTDARQNCRQDNIDLLPLNFSSNRLVSRLTDRNIKEVWIGAHKDPENPSAWKTISLRRGSDMTTWAPSHPDDEDCALFDNTGQLEGSTCSTEHPSVCLKDNLVLVKENKTWEEALQHCHDMERLCDSGGLCELTFGLLTLRHNDYNYVRDRICTADTDEVWTGLRFLGGHWFWLDGEKVEDEEPLPRCPSQRKHCGTLSKFDNNEWITRDCSEKRNFICAKIKNLEEEE